MKQILLNLRSGRVSTADVCIPAVRKGYLLIRSTYSVISPGTERMLAAFGSASWIQRIRQQPERSKAALRRIANDGLIPTVSAISRKLDQPVALGYSQSGVVVDVGKGVSGFSVGDRVASNGPHAEYVCVPENLAVKVPSGVSCEQAAFTSLGGVALQSIRLLRPELGETIVVMGLGLVGMLTALLLKSNGCRVVGVEPDHFRRELAEKQGFVAIDPLRQNVPDLVLELTGAYGADGVIIATSSHSDKIVSDAARMCRKRGRIVLSGVAGLNLRRSDFFEKELSFQVSCSYGPGRYEPAYEEKGLDYPYGLVRWTLNRNFQAFLELLNSGKVDLSFLISGIISVDEARRHYENLKKGQTLGCLISYPDAVEGCRESAEKILSQTTPPSNEVHLGIIGAGNFTRQTLLPLLGKYSIGAIASFSGVSGDYLAQKYNIPYSTTEYHRILENPRIGVVIITTRHDQHAGMVIEALKAGKHVLVEKPLALYHTELDEIASVLAGGCKGQLMVGFNRRFSPYVQKAKQLMQGGLIHVTATMNAGTIERNSWLHDRESGGGRVIGEACHLIDLITYLTGSRVEEVCSSFLGENPDTVYDNATIVLRFANGSTGTVHYLTNGSSEYPKERVELYGNGKTVIIDDYSNLKGYGVKGFSKLKGRRDKGHSGLLKAFVESVENGTVLVSPEELLNVSRATLSVYDSFSRHGWVSVAGGTCFGNAGSKKIAEAGFTGRTGTFHEPNLATNHGQR